MWFSKPPPNSALENLIVDPLPISHNAADPCSFKVSCDGKKFLLATDLGKVGNEVFEAMKIADLVMIEANHRSPDADRRPLSPIPEERDKV